MIILKKAVLPRGFKANGIACGLKKAGKLDLALFYSSIPANAACVFTTNKVIAAPLKLNKRYLKNNSKFQAILVNSANANCLTGKVGLRDAQESAKSVSYALKIKEESVLVNSTGIIGRRLDIAKIKDAISGLVSGLSLKGLAQAEKAIMTTDKFVKEAAVKFDIRGKSVTVCAVAKGAGMISPKMATLLCFIMTDANIPSVILKKALKESVDKSFNCITVDGCMSTNDSVMALANGEAGNKLIKGGNDYVNFVKVLSYVCLELAKAVVRDGEGATKFIEITVDKAKNARDAKTAALAIANSNLFKTAVYGKNPNFGRIFAAVGSCGIDVDEGLLKCRVSSLKKKDIKVYVEINKGVGRAVVYTSDLTPEYIKINAEYN
ncbi:MAG: bifunctional glutamate N-acetyltransferase/amino-acid acetyltransferase ArgJ [Candidatus Omnitrophota bacterium]|jgi:glutamate N-acetyltransferase/amino-acid N-acetyltransferase